MSRQHEDMPDDRGADALQEAANVAIKRVHDKVIQETAKGFPHDPAKDAVNWADLSCIEAVIGTNNHGESVYKAWVSEASPDAWRLSRAIEAELKELGWPGVEVVTEW